MGVFGVMSRTTCHMSISVDGFVAGPDQSRESPVGAGLEPVQVIHSPYATHIRYRLGRPAYYRS